MTFPTQQFHFTILTACLAVLVLLAQPVILTALPVLPFLDGGMSAQADDGWKPFAELDRRKAQRKAKRRANGGGRSERSRQPLLSPMNGRANSQTTRFDRGFGSGGRPPAQGAPFVGANSRAVESTELAPLTAPRAPPAAAVAPGYDRRGIDQGGARQSNQGGQSGQGGWEVGRYRDGGRPDERRQSGRQPDFDRATIRQGSRYQDNTGDGRSNDRFRRSSNSRTASQDPGVNPAEPFAQHDDSRPQGYQPPGTAQRNARFQSQQPESKGFSGNPWQGVDVRRIETLIGGLQIPPRSNVMHGLWRRLWLSDALPGRSRANEREGRNNPTGLSSDVHFEALRLEALYRSGLVADVVDVAAQSRHRDDPVLATLRARALIGLGKRDEGCRVVTDSVRPGRDLPRSINATAILVSGYCAAAAGKRDAAGLFAGLAREEGVTSPLALAVLDAISSGRKPELSIPKRMSLIDFRFVQLASSADPARILAKAEPALLAALALDTGAKPGVRLAAGERAAHLHAITHNDLAAIYTAQRFNSADINDPLPTRSSAPQRRALLLQAIANEREPRRAASFVAALWDLAKRDSLADTISRILLPRLDAMPRSRADESFTQTAIEIALLAGDPRRAGDWARAGASSRSGQGGYNGGRGGNRGARGGPYDTWLALIDIADAAPSQRRAEHLQTLAEMARAGRFKSDQLHRLATVLDALEYNIPIPLWEAASRTPQPKGGNLPKTGVLPQLATAASARQTGHTILLSLHSLGAGGASQMHMIALRDTIQALKRAGLQQEARQLAVEALIGAWPQAVNQR